jgi:2-polyprenyl-3-methyl-5-hydroxy-6-metoxy-1,4-benzoquinol methylase
MAAAASPAVEPTTLVMRSVPCNLCGATASTEVYASRLPDLRDRDVQEIFACTSSAYGECGPIVRCNACGFMYQNPQPDPDWILSAYEDVIDARYDDEREGRLHTFRHELERISPLIEPGRVLDIGSHVGVFLEVAAAMGWKAEGVEPSRWATDLARSRGLTVTCGTLDDLAVPPSSFDLVTLWDVIEHLPDPAEELWRLHKLLRPGGLVAISTMDVDAPIAQVLGRHWPWYMQMHLFYFSRKTLRQLVENAGYEVLEIRRHRRIVRIAYLVSRLERPLGLLYQPVVRAVERSGFGRRLVTVDLGDIMTLVARKPSMNGTERRNGHGAH